MSENNEVVELQNEEKETAKFRQEIPESVLTNKRLEKLLELNLLLDELRNNLEEMKNVHVKVVRNINIVVWINSILK